MNYPVNYHCSISGPRVGSAGAHCEPPTRTAESPIRLLKNRFWMPAATTRVRGIGVEDP